MTGSLIGLLESCGRVLQKMNPNCLLGFSSRFSPYLWTALCLKHIGSVLCLVLAVNVPFLAVLRQLCPGLRFPGMFAPPLGLFWLQ